VKAGETLLQRTDASVTYRIEATNYETFSTNVTVARKQSRQIAVKLARVMVPVALASDPPGAEFFVDGVRLDPATRTKLPAAFWDR